MFSEKIFLFLLVIGISISFFLFNDYMILGNYYFYILGSFLILDIYIKKKLELIHVWNVAFLFIIMSEIFTSDQIRYRDNIVSVLQYIFVANNLIFLGYISKNTQNLLEESSLKIRDNIPKYTPILILSLIAIYFLFKIEIALLVFAVGRNIITENSDDSFVLGAVFSALGYILPAITAYYYVIIKERSIYVAFFLSIPIFIILFLNGSRFPLLFAILGFTLVVKEKIVFKNKFKSFMLLVLLVFGLIFTSTIMKKLRSSKTQNLIVTEEVQDKESSIPQYVSKFMSPEGVLDMTTLMFEYFNTNEHLYGTSSSFITYFWIPRSVWPDKPKMLGYWFIRKYRNFSEGHSAAFGFTGDFYADFGYFSLFFILILGRLLKKMENFRQKYSKSKSYVIVLTAMFLPYTFFFVRSPITATMTFLGIYFFYFLFKFIFFESKKHKFSSIN